MGDPKRVQILGEDREHCAFVHDVLLGLGVATRDLHIWETPNGHGAGDAHVLKQFGRLLDAVRVRSARQRGLLLVAIVDADVGSVADRRRTLVESVPQKCASNGELTAPAAVLIPKRNIETWFRALSGDDVNEDDDYKSGVPNASSQRAAWRDVAERFVVYCKGDVPSTAPASLKDGVREIRRASVHLDASGRA